MVAVLSEKTERDRCGMQIDQVSQPRIHHYQVQPRTVRGLLLLVVDLVSSVAQHQVSARQVLAQLEFLVLVKTGAGSC